MVAVLSRSLLMLCVLLVACGEQQAAPADAGAQAQDTAADAPLGQLSDAARPVGYRLELTIDPDATHFSGHTEIDVELTEPADGVWLHGRDLEVDRVVARTSDGEEHPAGYRQVADIGVARVKFEEPLPAGAVTLVFDYRAPFNDSLEGLYRITTDGRNYASTQFEATSARLAFPSFDEPRFKVPFDITLTVREAHEAVTNTPAVDSEPALDGFTRIRFARTKPLPTYLLAFIVGPWDERAGDPIAATSLREEAIPLRGFAAAGKGDQLRYALANTSDILQALEQYFGTAYPYRKLDLIAVPDFSAGAMENAGAITYREQLLLFSEDSSIVRRQRFASVHAHELAHQWFGNLVTPMWWDDIWLNEAFATWMAAKIMHQLESEQGYDLRQLGAALEVMRVDAQVGARQIRQPITEHSDIGAAFDGITYQKGGAVLSMLERFVGAENFKRGIQRYMEEHRFGNADARDFVRAIAVTRPDLPEGQVEEAFFSFLEQPGTPLVALDWTCSDQGVTKVSIEQSRYLPVGSKGESERQWLLPLCLAYDDAGDRAEHCELVQGRSATLDLPTSSCPRYVMPNADAAGYYRFDLSQNAWSALLAEQSLTEAERLAVAASLSGGFRAGDLTVGEYLALVPALLGSENVEVVTAPLEDLEWIHDRLLTPENQRRLRTVLADYYAPVAERVPLQERPRGRAQVQLQSDLAALYALLIEAPTWRRQLTDRAVAFVEAREAGQQSSDGRLPSHLRETALAVAVETEGDEFGDRLLDLFHGTSDAVLREEILRSLSYGAGEAMLARLRELVLSDDLRDNEVGNVVGVQLAEPDSREAAWQWLLENFDAVAERLPYWFRGELVEYGSVFCSAGKADEIQRALGDKVAALGGGERSLALTTERVELCAALVQFHEDIANRQLSSAGDGV